jgi:hypothetical protein
VTLELCNGADHCAVRWNTVKMARGLGDFRNGLNAGGAGADYRDPLAFKTDPFLGPVVCVAGLALKALKARNARQNGR